MVTKHFYYDQDKVKELRMKVINLSLDVLNDKKSVEKWSTYKKELVSKIAPRVLPVLNAGRDDDKDLIPLPLLAGKTNVQRNNRIKKATEPDEEDSGCEG